MANILIINPNRWGRGITPIWIASHLSILKKDNHKVSLFDSTFYEKWSQDEIGFNTANQQYKPTNYKSLINFNKKDIFHELKKKIIEFKPNIVFWSALSSHIHGEGEYVNIEYGYQLLEKIDTSKLLLVAGGIQATANPKMILENFKKINFLISGESDFVLNEIANNFNNTAELEKINGVSFIKNNQLKINKRQKIISNLDTIPHYDYSLFDKQVFLRPYNGKIMRAIDYEMSRGCIYTCSYCVETVIQSYYDFNEKNKRGVLANAKNYIRSKSPNRIYDELKSYKEDYNINFVRCQDTNFLTIKRQTLKGLEELLLKNPLNIKLYIETRAEGINESSVNLLKNLGVDGVGMGIELSGQDFREEELNRFSNESAIVKGFKLLKAAGIKRTSYNIIGLPRQNEESIKNTIKFNKMLKPDNVTVAFFSPYLGTNEQKKSYKLNYFKEYQKQVDGQLRSLSKDNLVPYERLNFYKENFKRLVFEGN